MGSIVCKFGGSSVADADQIRKIVSIIQSDGRRRFIVISAPGKRYKEDEKITDLLLLCHELASRGQKITGPFNTIRERYLEIARELESAIKIEDLLAEIEKRIESGASKDFAASRGEYLCARLVAEYLGAAFIEAAEAIKFQVDGKIDETTYDLIAKRLSDKSLYVIPGFYGSTPDGKIRTFSRGGSDITGSLVARAVMAEIYENWTDVSGFLMTDPRLVKNPRPISRLTYREMRELASLGANVFHEEAVLPVSSAEIPINIRNTNSPDDPGTMIVSRRDFAEEVIAGIAGKPGFSLLFIEKQFLKREPGFRKRLFTMLEARGLDPVRQYWGIDTMSVILNDDQLAGKTKILSEAIRKELNPERIEIKSGLALVSTVGESLTTCPDIVARLFTALSEAQVKERIIDLGSSEITILVGLDSKDLEKALNALYRAFS